MVFLALGVILIVSHLDEKGFGLLELMNAITSIFKEKDGK